MPAPGPVEGYDRAAFARYFFAVILVNQLTLAWDAFYASSALRPSIGRLSEYVRTGSLDLVLTKPIDPQFYISFRRLNVWRIADIVLGFALAGYALTRIAAADWTVRIASFIVLFAAATVILRLQPAAGAIAAGWVKEQPRPRAPRHRAAPARGRRAAPVRTASAGDPSPSRRSRPDRGSRRCIRT